MATHSTLRKITRPRDDARPESGFIGYRSPIVAAAILIGIYVAMYLTVAAIVRVLTPPEAAAIVWAAPTTDAAPARDPAALSTASHAVNDR